MGMALVDFTRVRSSDCSWNWFGNQGESEPVTLRWQVTTLWIPRRQILAPTGALWRYQTPLVFWLFFGQQGSHCNSHSTKTTCFDRHLLILCYNDYDFFMEKFNDDEENEDCVFSFWFQSLRCANGKSKMWFCFEVCVPLLALQDLLLVLEGGPVTVMATNRWLPLLPSLILCSLVAYFPQIENWEQFCAEAQSVKIIFGCFRPAIYVLYVIHLQFLFLVVLAVLWFQSQLTLLWNPGPKRPWDNATRQHEEGPGFQVSFGNHKFKAKFRQDLDVKGSTG